MKIKCMYYDKGYTKKPTSYETAKEVQPNIRQTEISIEDLANGLSSGCTFKPALLNGSKSIDFISQQVFALDFDHNTTIDDELNRCKELRINPCFGYTSFSHTENEHRFRLVFCCEEVIEDIDIRNKLQQSLINAFSNSDNVTKDPTRIFYGGKTLIDIDFDNRIEYKNIIDAYFINSKKKEITPEKSLDPKGYDSGVKYWDNIKAISELNVDRMRDILGLKTFAYTGKKDIFIFNLLVCVNPLENNSIVCKSQMEVNYIISNINLVKFTGIYGTVRCILPKHNDKTPSAHIYTTDSGTQVYKCFGCSNGRAYPIISLVEILAKCKRSEAINFIKAVYNIQFDLSEKIRQQQQQMIDSANYLDTEEFKLTFPNLNSLIRTRKLHIQKLLMHFTQYVTEDGLDLNGKLVFFGSYKVLMEVCGIKSNDERNNRNKFAQSITLFSLLNMINKVPNDELPEKVLKKAQYHAINNNHHKLINFYTFEEYGFNCLDSNEEIAKHLKENNITLRGISREYILRTFGKELADKVFPQYRYENNLGTKQKSNDKTIDLTIKLLDIIEKQGYCFENEIKGKRGSSIELQWKKSIQEILNSYCLKRIRYTKAIKEQYNIDCSVFGSFIIIEA